LALAPERALGEFLGVEAEQLLADGEVVALGEEVRGDVLAALVPHLGRAGAEVAHDRVALALALDLELDAVAPAVPRPPAVEGRQQRAVPPAVTVEPVEAGDDRVEQARLAALVEID